MRAQNPRVPLSEEAELSPGKALTQQAVFSEMHCSFFLISYLYFFPSRVLLGHMGTQAHLALLEPK